MTVMECFKKYSKVDYHTFRTRYCRNRDLDDCLLLPEQSNSFSYRHYKNEKMARMV